MREEYEDSMNIKKIRLPIIMGWLLALLIMDLTWRVAHADVIYYNATTGEIVEAFKEPVPVHAGFAQVTIVNADAISWPVPGGCTAGKPKWSKVTIPATNPPTFAVRADLKFFKCQLVSSAADVDRVASEEIERLQLGQSDAELLRQAVWAIYALALKCPPTDVSAQCNTDRTKAKAIETSLTSLNVQIETIQKEAADFKAAQGW